MTPVFAQMPRNSNLCLMHSGRSFAKAAQDDSSWSAASELEHTMTISRHGGRAYVPSRGEALAFAHNLVGTIFSQLFVRSLFQITKAFWLKSRLAAFAFLGFFFSRFGAFLFPMQEMMAQLRLQSDSQWTSTVPKTSRESIHSTRYLAVIFKLEK